GQCNRASEQMLQEDKKIDEEDKKRRAEAKAKNNAESLVHTTEKKLSENGDKIDADLKGQIEAAIAETKEAIVGGDPEAMKTKSEALAQVSMQMGQKIYEAEQDRKSV